MAKKKAVTREPEPAPPKTWAETLTIDVEMTADEAADKARILRASREGLNEYQEKANRTRRLLDTHVKAMKAAIEAVETEVVTGRTPREVECTATLRKATDEEKKGKGKWGLQYGMVDIRRDDTGELVETRIGEYGDAQGVLGFDDDVDDIDDEDDDA